MTAHDRPAAGRAKDVEAWALRTKDGRILISSITFDPTMFETVAAKFGDTLVPVRITEITEQGGRNGGD